MCRKQVLVGWGVMVGQGSAPEGFANEHSSSNSPPDDHHPHHDIHCLELLRSVRDDDNCLHVGIFSLKVFMRMTMGKMSQSSLSGLSGSLPAA